MGFMSEALIGDEIEHALVAPDVKDFFKKFKKEEEKDSRHEAGKLFFLNEVDFLGMTSGAHVIPNYGHPTMVLVGEYKHHKGIYVRESADSLNTALIAPKYGWLFEVRTDHPQKGFFREPQRHMPTAFSLKSIKESLPTIENIVRMIEHYEGLVKARRFESQSER